ncbi:hypothetical protein CLU96_1353 [Chryseobacterium sp. 52]|nr:hypothetical protein CLU96_1353 [Chryseobacterium sp. 52]
MNKQIIYYSLETYGFNDLFTLRSIVKNITNKAV